MRVLLFCHHTPYIALLGAALPDVHLDVLPTRHAPTGWREDQRPRPENVEVWDPTTPDPVEGVTLDYWRDAYHGNAGPRPDLVIAQSFGDLHELRRAEYDGPLLYLSHNHFHLERPSVDSSLALWLADRDIPLVTISRMKAASWREVGYTGRLNIIHPYVPEGLPRWEPDHEDGYVLTVANDIRRPLFDLERWRRVTSGLNTSLVGEGNDGIPGAVGPSRSYQGLLGDYAHCSLYVNPTCPPYEDGWNLAALEALGVGCPILNLHGVPPHMVAFPQETFVSLGSGTDVTLSSKETFVTLWREALEEATRR